MTNYNERLDDILYDYWARHRNCDKGCQSPDNGEITKQLITSLMKELVAEAKPRKYQKEDFKGSEPDRRKKAFNRAIDVYEQNLLKALEEN